MMNILNGGKHADNTVDIQEFMIIPVGANSFAAALRMCAEVYQTLKKVIKDKGFSTGVGDEGGFAPDLATNEDALKLIVEAIEKTGYRPGEDVSIALDPASSEFYVDGKYVFQGENVSRSSEEMITLYSDWISRYPIVSIEDGLAENDWDGWASLTAKLGGKVQLVGDDIFVTNPDILKEGIQKISQIPSLSTQPDRFALRDPRPHPDGAKANYTAVVSTAPVRRRTRPWPISRWRQRRTDQERAPCRSERIAKYNQLLRIEEMLGDSAVFKGKDIFYNIRSDCNKKAGNSYLTVTGLWVLIIMRRHHACCFSING
jgi:enolase